MVIKKLRLDESLMENLFDDVVPGKFDLSDIQSQRNKDLWNSMTEEQKKYVVVVANNTFQGVAFTGEVDWDTFKKYFCVYDDKKFCTDNKIDFITKEDGSIELGDDFSIEHLWKSTADAAMDILDFVSSTNESLDEGMEEDEIKNESLVKEGMSGDVLDDMPDISKMKGMANYYAAAIERATK